MMNTGIMKFKNNSGKYGELVAIEGKFDIPFEIKRIYYIKNVPEQVDRKSVV